MIKRRQQRADQICTQSEPRRDVPVDVAVIAVARQLQLTEIAAPDHRHFAVVRSSHVPAFTRLPSSDA